MIEWLNDAARYAGEWLDYQMRMGDQPGCVVAIVADGAVLMERAFGHADLAQGIALTPRHRFRIASHSKTFTAAAIMKLREEGKLHLDDPVGRHVKDLSPAIGAVTIAQLLSHSSGIVRDGADPAHWQDRKPFFDEPTLRGELGAPLTIEANTRFKYSNVAYGLAGLVIETITGEAYVPGIMRNIVGPSGLTETTADIEGATNMASGHGGKLPTGRRFAIDGRNPTNALASATGFVSTAGDIARFIGSLDPNAKESVLSVASRREMTRQHWRIPHPEVTRHYGLGTVQGSVKGRKWFGHSGGFQGFITRTTCVPEWGITISVLTNAIDGMAHEWGDGIISILHQFAQHGRAAPEVADWAGRWWTIWGATDLVPMGKIVVGALPDSLSPFGERAEIEITGPNEGRIRAGTGFGNHGEPVRRVLKDGKPERLNLAGTEMLTEQALAREIEGLAR